MAKIKFITNELGNINVLNSDNSNLSGFIKHVELYKNKPELVYLNIDEDELNKTKNVYIHIRHNQQIDVKITLKELREIFKDKNISFKTKEIEEDIIILDLFLYE